MKYFSVFFLFIIVTISIHKASAQYTSKDTIIDNKIFRKNASYAIFSIGEGRNFVDKSYESNFRFDLNIPYHELIFNVGFIYQAKSFLLHSSDDRITSSQAHKNIHIGGGYKIEMKKFCMSMAAGPGITYGYNFHHIGPDSSIFYKGFFMPSFYTGVDFIYKPIYDMGVGLGFFMQLVKYYPVAGVQITLYLSNSYRGKIKY